MRAENIIFYMFRIRKIASRNMETYKKSLRGRNNYFFNSYVILLHIALNELVK